MNNKKARVIAYYLPQYHPIPENDQWWGKGFTEWTNVGKAKPLFRGHYQPRVPADLGYYDLRMPEIREAQAEMARNSGVEGFMYWHYWFGNGRRALERPFNEVLQSGKPDFPFCLGWANHSWSNQLWNSVSQRKKERKNIIAQIYPGEEDYIDHFYTVLPAFQDRRYMKINNNPIFLVYEPSSMPEPKHFMDIWNNLAVKNGLSGIHFIGWAGGWIENYQEILNLGYNAINANGQWRAESIIAGKYIKLLKHKLNSKFGGLTLNKYDYKKIIKHLNTDYNKKLEVYPTILPQWDRSPRSGKKSTIYHRSSPELFAIHLNETINSVIKKPFEHRMIFLKSWNEWAEGNYMEPDIKYGHGYLNKLKEGIFI